MTKYGIGQLLTAGVCFTSSVWAAESGNWTDHLQTGGLLSSGESLISGNGQYRFLLKENGVADCTDLVTGEVLWKLEAMSTAGSQLILKSDGNLVLVSASGSELWSSQTAGSSATELVLHNSGDLVLYKADAVVWAVSNVNAVVREEIRPNIVFILADDLGYGDLACYGHPYARTPNLDRLAAQGTRFNRFYVTGVTCCPSRTGFLTSRSPASYANYMADFGYQDRTTITELLSNAGYATGHFGKWHMGNDKNAINGVYGIQDVNVMGGDQGAPNGRDFPIFKAAADFIETNQDRPFYVNVWGHATHYPVVPSAELASNFDNVNVKRSDFGRQMQGRFDDCERIGGNVEKSMRNYLGDVYGLDMGVGLLLDKIEELGLAENTIVVFSSDQGPAPIVDRTEYSQNMLGYAGGLRGTKHTQYEGGVRSPFIIRWPNKVPAGKVNKTSIFSGLDWLPTLALITGVEIDGSWYEGEDVSDIWMGADRSRKNPLFWRTSNTKAEVSMLQDNWKLHVNGSVVELYDLSSDEHEEKNVAGKYPKVVKKLQRKLDKWVSQLPKRYAKNNDPKIVDPVRKPEIIRAENLSGY